MKRALAVALLCVSAPAWAGVLENGCQDLYAAKRKGANCPFPVVNGAPDPRCFYWYDANAINQAIVDICNDYLATKAQVATQAAQILALGGPTGTPAPVLTTVVPNHGAAGDLATLTGNYFNAPSSVNVSGFEAQYERISDTSITFMIPPEALVGAGTVYVTTPAGPSNALAFTVDATVAPPVIGTFSASPSTVGPGQYFGLNVSTSGATSCSIDNGIGSVPCLGTRNTAAPASTTTYTLTATNSSGSVTATATVTVNAVAPVCNSFTASPATINGGGSSTLAWNVTGAGSVVIDHGAYSGVAAAGNTTVSPAATTTYVLTATNSIGSCAANATVTVEAASGYTGWSTGYYYPPWLAVGSINWDAYTHVVHFGFFPSGNTITTPANMASFVAGAHGHSPSRKALLGLGGDPAAADTAFRAISNATTFANNVLAVVDANGYDGVDLDWETADGSVAAAYLALAQALRTACDSSGKILTIAATPYLPNMACANKSGGQNCTTLLALFDQINVMSYKIYADHANGSNGSIESQWTTAGGVNSASWASVTSNWTTTAKDKIGIGLGMGDPGDPGEVDTTTAACTAKVQYSKTGLPGAGVPFGGWMTWGMGAYPSQTAACEAALVAGLDGGGSPPPSGGTFGLCAGTWQSTASSVPAPSVGDSGRVQCYAAPATGHITKISFLADASYTVGVKPVVYASGPGSLVASGTAVSSLALGWNDLLFSSPVAVTSGTTYCFGLLANGLVGAWAQTCSSCGHYFNAVAGSYATPPASWPGGGGATNYEKGYCATYTVP